MAKKAWAFFQKIGGKQRAVTRRRADHHGGGSAAAASRLLLSAFRLFLYRFPSFVDNVSEPDCFRKGHFRFGYFELCLPMLSAN
jgi:hypothetical protein